MNSHSHHLLQQRALMLAKVRQFFDQRGFLEVDTPLLSTEIIPELHIEPVAVSPGQFLQSSPEAHMKRLLAAGATAIYQITRSFRHGEQGRLHRPEFTLVEWYRTGDDMAAGMKLLDLLAQHLLACEPAVQTGYREAFIHQLGICPHQASCHELAQLAESREVVIAEGMDRTDRDDWLNLLLDTCVQPNLGRQGPEILYHYPASQAALAKMTTDKNDLAVAERFELYLRGVELANGYHELTDATELRQRLLSVNSARQSDGRQPLPMPERLLAAMESGLPPSTGVALGLDRLLMLTLNANSIDQVLWF